MSTKSFYEEIEQKITANLLKAKKDVKIAVAWFTNPAIFELLVELVNKDISIEIILCDDNINFTNPKLNFQRLIDKGVSVRISQFPYLMHNKFCVIDGRILITGSYNWTLRAEQYNFENIIISTDKELINDFEIYFKKITVKTKRIISIPNMTLHSYYSQNEMDFELELEDKNKEDFPEETEQQENIPYTDEVDESIDEAQLLYNNAEHLKCIEFCQKQIRKNPLIPDFHLIIASSYWRTDENKKLIASAQSAIAINNELYDAYNLLGIGYSRITGKEQQSIKNYNICLTEFPDEHSFLRNRAISRINLESDINLPQKFRDNYGLKADEDLKKIIEIVSNKKEKDWTYSELHSRAVAYQFLEKNSLALKDIDLSLKKYSETLDKFELDKNEYLEMKSLQRELIRLLKTS